MSIYQVVIGSVLVLVLIWFGLNTIVKQGRGLFERPSPGLIPQLPLVVRVSRMLSGVIMVVLGVMLLVGLVCLEAPAQVLADQSDNAVGRGVPVSFTPEQKSFAAAYAWFWIWFLMLLFSMVISSTLDALFSWRFTRKHRHISFHKNGCEEKREIHFPLMEQPKHKQDYWCENFFHHN